MDAANVNVEHPPHIARVEDVMPGFFICDLRNRNGAAHCSSFTKLQAGNAGVTPPSRFLGRNGTVASYTSLIVSPPATANLAPRGRSSNLRSGATPATCALYRWYVDAPTSALVATVPITHFHSS